MPDLLRRSPYRDHRDLRRADPAAGPPVFPGAAIDDPALPEVLAELAAARADEMDAGTVNRELSIVRKAIGRRQRQGWIECDPTIGIERRPAPPDRTKALAENQIAALWRLDVALREKTQWKMLYESAARADERTGRCRSWPGGTRRTAPGHGDGVVEGFSRGRGCFRRPRPRRRR
ncbi:hypothetical protein [Streptosporangium sp. NPDC050280]|uniref:hypothetical protein n=1 Tax=unclassified Streptosporangium TaxID=2632669 RepID=UPI00341C358D